MQHIDLPCLQEAFTVLTCSPLKDSKKKGVFKLIRSSSSSSVQLKEVSKQEKTKKRSRILSKKSKSTIFHANLENIAFPKSGTPPNTPATARSRTDANGSEHFQPSSLHCPQMDLLPTEHRRGCTPPVVRSKPQRTSSMKLSQSSINPSLLQELTSATEAWKAGENFAADSPRHTQQWTSAKAGLTTSGSFTGGSVRKPQVVRGTRQLKSSPQLLPRTRSLDYPKLAHKVNNDQLGPFGAVDKRKSPLPPSREGRPKLPSTRSSAAPSD